MSWVSPVLLPVTSVKVGSGASAADWAKGIGAWVLGSLTIAGSFFFMPFHSLLSLTSLLISCEQQGKFVLVGKEMTMRVGWDLNQSKSTV